jgi:hypothetical protein
LRGAFKFSGEVTGRVEMTVGAGVSAGGVVIAAKVHT